MTRLPRGQLTIIVATGEPTRSPAPDASDPSLCGRSAADWLLDTVVAVRPSAVSFAGCGAAGIRKRAEARPALRRALAAGDREGQPGVTVVLSCLSPLLRPASIRQAIGALAGSPAGHPGLRTVVIRSCGAVRWWSGAQRTAMTAAVAYAGHADDCPDWLARLDPADARAFQSRLRGIGAQVVVTNAGPVESLHCADPAERQLAEAALYQKIAAGWQRRGVRIDDPSTTRIDATVRIGRGARIRPHTELAGRTVIGAGASIGPVTTMVDSRAGAGCVIRYSVCEQVTIGDDANIGPFSWLRSGTRLGARTRAGSFVELASSVIGDDSQIPHLGGLIGTVVGKGCNIAGLSGTAIFDGQAKHRIEIGDHVSIGAATMLVAPMSIGDGAYTAAGSTLTRDVPSGALAIARPRQLNVQGWVARQLPGTAAARAARLHRDLEAG